MGTFWRSFWEALFDCEPSKAKNRNANTKNNRSGNLKGNGSKKTLAEGDFNSFIDTVEEIDAMLDDR